MTWVALPSDKRRSISFGLSVGIGLALWGIGLAVSVPLFLIFNTDDTSSKQEVGLAIFFAVIIAAGASIALLAFSFVCEYLYARRTKPLAHIAMWSVRRAAMSFKSPVESLGIAERAGNLVIRLDTGSVEGVNLGDRFIVYNSVGEIRLGLIEVIEADPESCLCTIYDRTGGVEFWEQLEFRMKQEFQPPQGVNFSRQIDQSEIDLTEKILRYWGG